MQWREALETAVLWGMYPRTLPALPAWHHRTNIFVCWPANPAPPTTCLLSPVLSSPVSDGTPINMNIPTWIFISGLSILFWLLPVEALDSVDPDHQGSRDVGHQVQLALEQFQAYQQAKTIQDISFNRRNRVNTRYRNLEWGKLSGSPECPQGYLALRCNNKYPPHFIYFIKEKVYYTFTYILQKIFHWLQKWFPSWFRDWISKSHQIYEKAILLGICNVKKTAQKIIIECQWVHISHLWHWR